MISSRQEIDLRAKLERLDALLLRSAGVDPLALTFEFRPLWQMDAAAWATIALQKAQATQIYAGLGLWPTATTARLVEAQLIEDGFYPGAETIFAEAAVSAPQITSDAFSDYLTEPREPNGRCTSEGGASSIDPVAFHLERERRRERKRRKKLKQERKRREGVPEEQRQPSEGAAHEQPREPNPQPEAAAPRPEEPPPSLPEPAQAAPPPVEPFSPPPAVFKPDGIPDHWIETPTDSEGGLKWANPDNPNQNVRSMPGDPYSPYPHQQVPYIVHQSGSYRDVNGDPILGSKPRKAPEAHIPADQFKFTLQ